MDVMDLRLNASPPECICLGDERTDWSVELISALPPPRSLLSSLCVGGRARGQVGAHGGERVCNQSKWAFRDLQQQSYLVRRDATRGSGPCNK